MGSSHSQAPLTGFQTVSLISSSYLPILFWQLPRFVVQRSGYDAQWALLGSIVMGLIAAILQGYISERFPRLLGPDMAVAIAGPWIGKIIGISYVPGHVMLVSFGVWWTADALKSFFPDTPVVALYLILLLGAFRGAWLGVFALARTASIVYPVVMVGALVTFGLVLLQASDFHVPHVVTSWPSTFDGIYLLMPLFMGINITCMLPPVYRHLKGRSFWYAAMGLLPNCLVLVAVLFACLFNLGWQGTEALSNPVLVVVQLMRMSGFLVERLGILVIIISTSFVLLFAANQIWVVSVLAARACNKSADSYRLFLVPSLLAVVGLMLFFHSTAHKELLFYRIVVPSTWIQLIIVNGILVIVDLARGGARRMRQTGQPG